MMRSILLSVIMFAAVAFVGCKSSDNGNSAVYGTVALTNDGNGFASASVDGTFSSYIVAGKTVTIVASPNFMSTTAYVFKEWTVVKGDLTLSSTTTNPATFVMPAGNVTIKASFVLKP